MKIRKGDRIQVIKGKDRGKTGEVLTVLPLEMKVVVRGINMIKRHTRPKKEGAKGERIEKEAPLSVSNVMILCPHTNKPTRIAYKMEGKEKVRYSVRAKKAL